MRLTLSVVLFKLYLIILPVVVAAQSTHQRELRATQWVNDSYLLHVIDDSLMLIQPSGMDSTKYQLHNDTLGIYYDVQNVRNDNRWPPRDQGWIYYRIVHVNEDSLSLQMLKAENQTHRFMPGIGNPTQIINLINIDKLNVPITSFQELNVEQIQYITSSGTTDTNGKIIYADTTWTVKRLQLRPRKIIVFNGLKKTAWPGSADVDTYQQTHKTRQRISRKDFARITKGLSRIAWLLKSNPVNSRYLFMTFTGEINNEKLNVTAGHIHPLLHEFFSSLERYSTNKKGPG